MSSDSYTFKWYSPYSCSVRNVRVLMEVRRRGTLLSEFSKTSKKPLQTADSISRPGSELVNCSTSDTQLSPGGDTTREMSWCGKVKKKKAEV